MFIILFNSFECLFNILKIGQCCFLWLMISRLCTLCSDRYVFLLVFFLVISTVEFLWFSFLSFRSTFGLFLEEWWCFGSFCPHVLSWFLCGFFCTVTALIAFAFRDSPPPHAWPNAHSGSPRFCHTSSFYVFVRAWDKWPRAFLKNTVCVWPTLYIPTSGSCDVITGLWLILMGF